MLPSPPSRPFPTVPQSLSYVLKLKKRLSLLMPQPTLSVCISGRQLLEHQPSPSQLLPCLSWRLFLIQVPLIPAFATTSSLSWSPGKAGPLPPPPWAAESLALITSPIITLQALAGISPRKELSQLFAILATPAEAPGVINAILTFPPPAKLQAECRHLNNPSQYHLGQKNCPLSPVTHVVTKIIIAVALSH